MSPQPRAGADPAGLDGRLVVPNAYSELERVEEWVRRFAVEHELAREHAYALDLALAEALTNIMSYAYRDDARHDIVVELNLRAAEIRVQIEDDGVPFNPLELPVEAHPQTLDAARSTGRGILLIRSFMSKLHYARRDNRNVLTMVLDCAGR